MKKRMTIMLIILGIVFGGLFAWKSFEGVMMKKFMSQMGSKPQTVSTITATKQKWETLIEGVGTLRAVRGVDISSEVSGLVEGIYFESGDQVEAGTLLVKLRVDDEVASLAALQAEAHLAGLTYERDYRQLKENTVAQATVDSSVASLEKAKAEVARQEAEIAKKFIRAPFAGKIGIRQVDLGQYINAGEEVVTLQSLDPIFFDFFLPQQELSKVKLGQEVSLTTDVYKDKKYVGKVWAINSKVDQSTRNVLIRAAVDNSEKQLLPGMYGVINIDLGVSDEYITIPQTAITYNPYGDTVFLVREAGGMKVTSGAEDDADGLNPKEDSIKEAPEEAKMDQSLPKGTKIADQKFILLGPTRGDQVAVLKGLNEGDVVITAGQLKLQNGSPIVIDNKIVPTDDPDPHPHQD